MKIIIEFASETNIHIQIKSTTVVSVLNEIFQSG